MRVRPVLLAASLVSTAPAVASAEMSAGEWMYREDLDRRQAEREAGASYGYGMDDMFLDFMLMAGAAALAQESLRDNDVRQQPAAVAPPSVAASQPPSGPILVANSSDGWLAIRTGPGTAYDRIGELLTGQAGVELERSGDWSRVRAVDSELVGWIYRPFTVGRVQSPEASGSALPPSLENPVRLNLSPGCYGGLASRTSYAEAMAFAEASQVRPVFVTQSGNGQLAVHTRRLAPTAAEGRTILDAAIQAGQIPPDSFCLSAEALIDLVGMVE